MKCSKCSADTRVIYTHPEEAGRFRFRIRRCINKKCGGTFNTIEGPVEFFGRRFVKIAKDAEKGRYVLFQNLYKKG